MADYYTDGQQAAREAQDALAAGKTWDQIRSEMSLTDPMDAAHILEEHERVDPQDDLSRWWKGYVSRWD